jgi:hypothetical protein
MNLTDAIELQQKNEREGRKSHIRIYHPVEYEGAIPELYWSYEVVLDES